MHSGLFQVEKGGPRGQNTKGEKEERKREMDEEKHVDRNQADGAGMWLRNDRRRMPGEHPEARGRRNIARNGDGTSEK